MNAESPPAFVATRIDSPITEVAVPIAGYKDGHWSLLGTGVLLASNIAITARHVVEGYIDYYHNLSLENFASKVNEQDRFSLWAMQYVNQSKNGALWSISAIYYAQITDIVFLQLRSAPEEQEKIGGVRIRVRAPKLGETVAAFGYTCTEIVQHDKSTTFHADGYTATGVVKAVYPDRRDSSSLNFPCFEVNARFDGGMSGGPVFDSEGYLCGLVCKNLPPALDDPEGQHTSWITTLWPMLAIRVSYNRVGHPLDISYPALELAKEGFIHCDGWETVEPIYNDAGGLLGVRHTT
jgi:V8-like Glu-specific endopeptidase